MSSVSFAELCPSIRCSAFTLAPAGTGIEVAHAQSRQLAPPQTGVGEDQHEQPEAFPRGPRLGGIGEGRERPAMALWPTVGTMWMRTTPCTRSRVDGRRPDRLSAQDVIHSEFVTRALLGSM